MKLPGHPALAGHRIRLMALTAGLDQFPTPATYIVTADADGDFETEALVPPPGPYDLAIHTTNGWLSPVEVVGEAGKGLHQYCVGGFPGPRA
jgi:hypothetical protein